MKRAVPLAVMLAALGCQALPPVASPGGRQAPAPRAASAAPSRSPLPAVGAGGQASPGAAASTSAPGATASPGALAPPATGKFQLPTRVTPQLPASLRLAAGLVGADGASLVGADGGTLVAAGGLNYAVMQAPALQLSEVIKGQLGIYLVTTVIIEALLRAAAVASLQPGATITFPDQDNPDLTAEEKRQPENHLTVRLRLAADHAVVDVFRGPAPDAARQIAGVSFTSPTRGRALLRDLAPKKDGKQDWIATAFDLDAGSSTADLYSEGPGGERARVHIVFTATPGAPAGQPTFKVRTAGYGKNPAKQEDGVLELSANFRDEGAAAIVGLAPAEFKAVLGENLVFLPSDGSVPNPANTAPHVFFLGADGKDLPPETAPAALRAIVPPDDDVQKPYMTDPTVPADRAPLQEPEFQFPD